MPEALGRAVRELAGRVDAGELDALWLFPPLRAGRRESGLVAATRFAGGERRSLLTVAYRAEETGRGIDYRSSFEEEGEAPADRLPRVMAGVSRRSPGEPGEPRRVRLEGDRGRLEELLRELEAPSRNEELPRE